MAVIKAIVIKKGSVGQIIHYIGNSNKTDDCALVTGIHCSPDTRNAELDMQQIKNIYNKKHGILGIHIIQSFKPGEIDAEKAHQIGVQLANELWCDRFQVYIGTHIDKAHIHNHIFINSVSYRDGKKLHWNRTEYFNTREYSDKYCRAMGLSTIDSENSRKYYKATKIYVDKYMKTNAKLAMLRQDIDDAIYLAQDFRDFVNVMGTFGYDVSYSHSWDRQYYTVTDRTTKINYEPWFIFGDDYKYFPTEDRIWKTNGFMEDYYLAEGITRGLVLSFYVPQIVAFDILILIVAATIKIAKEIHEENVVKNFVQHELNYIRDKDEENVKKIDAKIEDKAEKIIEVNNLLSENKIASENDLNEFMSMVTLKIGKLRNTKEDLITYVRKNGSNDELNQKIENITKEIDELNKQIQIVNFINGELRKIKAIKLVIEKERETTAIQKEQKKLEKQKKKNKEAR